MAYRRMKLRNGTYGEDMWKTCSAEHYDGVRNFDLRAILPPKSSARIGPSSW
jgi:hypothetical protein